MNDGPYPNPEKGLTAPLSAPPGGMTLWTPASVGFHLGLLTVSRFAGRKRLLQAADVATILTLCQRP
jgi:hypothetical protein